MISIRREAIPSRAQNDTSGLTPGWSAKLLTSFRYQGGKRDLRLDLLRGFAAFAMIADHVGPAEHSWLAGLTGGNRFFVSAAEAFVFISGLVMGMVYHQIAEKSGIRAALKKAAKRAWTLYLVTIAVGLLFVGLSIVARAGWALTPRTAVSFVLEYVTLRRTFFLADIPLMYTFLLLLAIPALWLLSKGLSVVVVAASAGVWLLWQLDPGRLEIPWRVEDNSVFHLAAWQILFIGGLLLGWYRRQIEEMVRVAPARLRAIATGLTLIAALGLYAAQVLALGTVQGSSFGRSVFLDKADVPIGRLLAFAVFAAFAYLVVSFAWRPVRFATGWLLLPLGKNALTAYSLHIFLVLTASKLMGILFARGVSPLETTLIQLACVLTVWTAVVVEPLLRREIRRALAPRDSDRSALALPVLRLPSLGTSPPRPAAPALHRPAWLLAGRVGRNVA